MAGGRPSKYASHVQPKLLLIEAWARDGLILEDIAKNLDVALSTFNDYKTKYPELLDALKRGQEVVDVMVENSLFKRAMGYSYEEVTREQMPCKPYENEEGIVITHMLAVTKIVTKEVNPDTTAQIFWLKNRRPQAWRDKKDIDVTTIVKLEDFFT